MTVTSQRRFWKQYRVRGRRYSQLIPDFFRTFFSKLRAAYHQCAKCIRPLWSGTEVELLKVIVHTSRWRSLRKCLVHLPSMLATVVVASLNLATFFFGNQYLGSSSDASQNFDNLALQITAKLFELCIVASLVTVLMDLLRRELLRGSSGLPLGILTATTRFTDISYLLSPDFRWGIHGLPKRKAISLGFLIVLCSVLALLAGPSSALLLIPRRYTDWPAGAAKFFMLGTNESIWPSQLDSQSIGGAHCMSPSESVLERQLLNMSSCIWSGYPNLLQFYRSTHFARGQTTILIKDGLVERNMEIREVWAYAVHVPTCLYSEVLSVMWYSAIFNARSALSGPLHKTANLRYSTRGGSIMTMPSQVPIVRTNCFVNSSVTFADVVDKTYYPLQPTDGSGYSMGRQYSFNTKSAISNTSRISTTWFETPDGEPIGTHIAGGTVTGRSSAYLNVEIPVSKNTVGVLASCSVTAVWLQANILGTGGIWTGGRITYQTDPAISWANPIVFPDSDGRTGRPVRLKRDWLETLAPTLENGTDSTWTSLSYMLSQIGVDNSTELIMDWSQAASAIESVVSAIIADGMSRIGFEQNGGLANKTSDLWPVAEDAPAGAYDPLLAGNYVLPLAHGYNGNASDITEMHWSTTVEGLGYRANSAPYYLALLVLFLQFAIAVVHTCWVLSTKEMSTSWRSNTELISLALISEPPSDSTFEHVAGGIEHYSNLELPIRIRTTSSTELQDPKRNVSERSSKQDRDEVQMILGSNYSQKRHSEVIPERAY